MERPVSDDSGGEGGARVRTWRSRGHRRWKDGKIGLRGAVDQNSLQE